MDPARPRWRLIVEPALPPAWNMAADEAILRRHAAGAVPPTVRLYAWDRPVLSLGYAQDIARVGEMTGSETLEIVRRPTGGRAVRHGDDLTVAVIVRPEVLGDCGRSVVASYRAISRGFVRGFAALGIAAEFGTGGAREARSPDCFASAARCDLVGPDGRKLVGSAQARRFGAILQQSSVRTHPRPLRGSPPPEAGGGGAVFGQGCAEQRAAPSRLGRGAEGWVDALTSGLEEALGVRLEPGELSVEERELAVLLAERKYASEEWTVRRREPVLQLTRNAPR